MDCTILTTLVPVSTVKVLFQVSGNTIRRWRREEGLPFEVVVGNSNDIILYNLTNVLAWSRDMQMSVHLDAALEFQKERAKKWETLASL